jgi:hypothetical protein
MQMKELNVRLNIDQLNLVLEALGQQSYIRVYDLIDHIQNQVKGQLNNATGNGHSAAETIKQAEAVLG